MPWLLWPRPIRSYGIHVQGRGFHTQYSDAERFTAPEFAGNFRWGIRRMHTQSTHAMGGRPRPCLPARRDDPHHRAPLFPLLLKRSVLSLPRPTTARRLAGPLRLAALLTLMTISTAVLAGQKGCSTYAPILLWQGRVSDGLCDESMTMCDRRWACRARRCGTHIGRINVMMLGGRIIRIWYMERPRARRRCGAREGTL